jgi:hypothetical protein
MSMTITEALAEIKTIGKRLEKKRTGVLQNIGRDARLKDPLDGGTVEFVKRERQAITDLEARIVTIRTAIASSNLSTFATVGAETRTVFEWLTFRREVAEGRRLFLAQMNNYIRQVREKVQKDGGRVITANVASTAIVEGSGKQAIEVIIHLDEKELLEREENLLKILGDLDGKLSLLNATTVIDV